MYIGNFGAGVIEYAVEKKSLIGGDDFKSGQTKMKSVLVDFLVGAGIKVIPKHLVWFTGSIRFSLNRFLWFVTMYPVLNL